MKNIISLLSLFLLSFASLTCAQQFPEFPNNNNLENRFALQMQNDAKIKFHLAMLKLKSDHAAQQAQKIELPGLTNFYKVSDELYRGAKPEEEGYKQLANLGIKTIVSLQVAPQNKELIKKLGMQHIHIPINPLDMKDKYAEQFLSIMANPVNHPVYVHCLFGSDRTGTMVALYRIYIQHWTKQTALKEMRDKKYGFREIFLNLKQYIKSVNLPYKYTPEDMTPTIRQGK